MISAPGRRHTMKKKKTEKNVFDQLSAPARRALLGAGIDRLDKLADYTEEELLALHGLGPASLPKLRQALSEAGLGLKESNTI